MEWSAYRDRTESAGDRYTVPALFAEAESFAAFCSELVESSEPAEIDQVAGIGFVSGAVLAWELDAAFVSVRKTGKLPIAEHRISDSLVE